MVFPFGFYRNPDIGTASLFSTISRGIDVGGTPIPLRALTEELMSHFCNEAPKSSAGDRHFGGVDAAGRPLAKAAGGI